jgi:hypothetical protein
MKGIKFFAAVGLITISVTACSKDKTSQQSTAQQSPELAAQQQQQSGEKPQYKAQNELSTTATVEAIDQKTRMVTLRGPQGNSVTFQASDSVKNLSQVHVGDKVLVHYYEALAINVKPPGEAINDSRTDVTGSAAPGETPAGIAARQTTITATVDSIDRNTQLVTLRGPAGNLKTVKVRNPKNLENVKVGDQVVITYTEALAVAIDKVD